MRLFRCYLGLWHWVQVAAALSITSSETASGTRRSTSSTQSTDVSQTTSTSSAVPDDGASRTKTYIIIAVVCAAVIGIAVTGALGLCLYRRRKRRLMPPSPTNSEKKIFPMGTPSQSPGESTLPRASPFQNPEENTPSTATPFHHSTELPLGSEAHELGSEAHELDSQGQHTMMSSTLGSEVQELDSHGQDRKIISNALGHALQLHMNQDLGSRHPALSEEDVPQYKYASSEKDVFPDKEPEKWRTDYKSPLQRNPSAMRRPSELEGSEIHPSRIQQATPAESLRMSRGRTTREMVGSEHWTFLRGSSATDGL